VQRAIPLSLSVLTAIFQVNLS